MSNSRNIVSNGIAVILALAALGIGGRAEAADYLRGAYAGERTPASAGVDWAGVYGGVHVGISVGQSDPRAMASSLASSALPNTVITNAVAGMIAFKETNKSGMSYGGFAGMNWLWEDVVLGVEVDYTRSDINSAASSTQARTFRPTASTDEYDIVTNASSRAKLNDWGTFRGRIGYAAGMFMPYLTAGIAVGNLDSRATTSGTWTRYDVSAPPARVFVSNGNFSGMIGRRGVTYGSAFGAGVDMQLMPGTFLRAELQHVQFASGGKRPDISINTARVGGGVKF